MAVAPSIEAQYSRGDLRSRIESALQAAGKSAERLEVDDLAQLDEFHLLGRPATLALARLAGISAGERVLDLGAGLAGPARLIAHDLGAEVVALDLAAEYCEIAEWLNEATGLSDRITVVHAGSSQPRTTFDIGTVRPQASPAAVRARMARLIRMWGTLGPFGTCTGAAALQRNKPREITR